MLIEWTLTATVGENDVEIEAVDRFTLRGDRATEGVAYFNAMPLWARIDRSVAQDEALEDRVQAMVTQES